MGRGVLDWAEITLFPRYRMAFLFVFCLVFVSLFFGFANVVCLTGVCLLLGLFGFFIGGRGGIRVTFLFAFLSCCFVSRRLFLFCFVHTRCYWMCSIRLVLTLARVDSLFSLLIGVLHCRLSDCSVAWSHGSGKVSEVDSYHDSTAAGIYRGFPTRMVSLLYIKLKMHHSCREPSIYSLACVCSRGLPHAKTHFVRLYVG